MEPSIKLAACKCNYYYMISMYCSRRTFQSFVLLSLGALLMVGCTKTANYSELKVDDIIVAMGDQFTAGTGSSERFSYPSLLAKETKATILNLGQPGRSAGDVMSSLKPTLDSGHVKLVVLTIGFNDLQQGSDLRFLTGYLTEVITTLERYKIPLMLVGIPALPYKGSNNPHPVFDQLAGSYKFIYEPNAFIDVLKTPGNMETPSQFTAEGYRVFAENIEARLRLEGFLR